MNYEQQLLSQLAGARDLGDPVPIEEAILFEQELARFYMPAITSDASDDELFAWGKKFKDIWTQRLELFRNGTLD